MPTLPPNSIDSQPPFENPYSAPGAEQPSPPTSTALKWPLAIVLFGATVLTILAAGARYVAAPDAPIHLRDGIPFAVSLLAILLAHEFGHFIFARIHRVNSSLPLFIPVPFISPFGTMGAVILMRDRIRSRNALVDIGASGPIAGLVVAIPILLFGLSHSSVRPIEPHGQVEGQCLLYLLLKWIALGPIPPGSDVYLHPVAFAGWVGLLVTMLNLIPIGQLDGGHVAYALLGPRQNKYSRYARFALLALFPLNLALYGLPVLRTGTWHDALDTGLSAGLSWLVWFVVLTALARVGGSKHPPTEPGELSPLRKMIAVVSLVIFALLFMPALMVVY
jgi:membrane-associated protease RseP (regulator of RpoE activity)